MFIFFLCGRLIHGGQLLNGLAGPTIMSAGPFLSTTWFAPDQRATATAVASLFCYLGGAASFLVGPLVVPAPNDTLAGVRLVAAAGSISSIRSRIQLVMYAGIPPTSRGGAASPSPNARICWWKVLQIGGTVALNWLPKLKPECRSLLLLFKVVFFHHSFPGTK